LAEAEEAQRSVEAELSIQQKVSKNIFKKKSMKYLFEEEK
jgi:hypothetical protein